MSAQMPRTRLSTRLSGSAQETQNRILNIFQGQRRRPPALLVLLLLCAIALCGSLVACQDRADEPVQPSGTPATSPEPERNPPHQLPEAVEGEYILGYPIQAGGHSLTLHLYAKAISEDYPDYRGVRQVVVADEDGQILQTLSVQKAIDSEWGEEGDFFGGRTQAPNEETMISIVDLDSDGSQDFGLAGWSTNGANLPCYYWLWDAIEEKFVYRFCLSNAEPTQVADLPGDHQRDGLIPRDHAYPVILSTTREDAGTYYTTRYLCQPTALIPLYQTRTVLDAAGTQTAGEYLYLNGDWVQIPGDGSPIPDDILAQLIGRYGEQGYDFIDQSGFQTEFVQAGSGRTLAVVRSIGGPRVGGLNNLFLGVIDNASWNPLGDFYIIGGDDGHVTTWQVGDGALYLLCSNTYANQGQVGLSGLGFFRYDGAALERLTQPTDTMRDLWPRLFSGQTIPEDLLDLACPFWEDHKAVARDSGLDLYRLTDDWAPPAPPTGNQWTYVGYLPFA